MYGHASERRRDVVLVRHVQPTDHRMAQSRRHPRHVPRPYPAAVFLQSLVPDIGQAVFAMPVLLPQREQALGTDLVRGQARDRAGHVLPGG